LGSPATIGTPQIQNIIPTTFFGTDTWAAPVLGTLGSIFVLAVGMAYLEWRRRAALRSGEGYGDPATLLNEPTPFTGTHLAHAGIAVLPLVLVFVSNKLFTLGMPHWYGGGEHSFLPSIMGNAAPVVQDVAKIGAIWAVVGALLVGILSVLALAWRPVVAQFCRGHSCGDQRCGAGGHEHRIGIRLRCGDRRIAGLHGGGQCAGLDPGSAAA